VLPASEVSSKKGAHHTARVFVVDDDCSVRRALGRLLRASGYETELFGAGEAYVAGPPPPRPACLLVDIRMPGMSGIDLQRAIRGTAMELPIVFITGHADEETLESLAGESVRVLFKPIDEAALKQAVEQALARSVERPS
jgi:FixJ family two-component response regulator